MNIEIIEFIKEHEAINHTFFDNVRDVTKHQCNGCKKEIEAKYWNAHLHFQSKLAIFQCDITEDLERNIAFVGCCPECNFLNVIDSK